MKITMYELLGMIKDGKAPKKIKYNGLIYYANDFGYFTDDGLKLRISMMNNLNDTVEILEEDKKIEKTIIELKHIDIDYFDDEKYTPEQRINVCMNIINDLIDEINKIKGGKNEN